MPHELVARGTEDAPILFLGTVGDSFSQIVFGSTSVPASWDEAGNYIDGSILEWVVVDNAGSGNQAAIDIYNSGVALNNVVVQNVSGTGVSFNPNSGSVQRVFFNNVTVCLCCCS